MDDPWADSPSPSTVVIPPRPPKADRRSIPIPQPPKAVDSELTEQDQEEEEEEVKAETATETRTEMPEQIVDAEPIESESRDGDEDVKEDQEAEAAGDAEADGFDDFDDFDAPAGGPSFSTPGGEGEDGFGDFGDFEEGDFEEQANGPIIDNQQEAVAVVEEPVRKWSALNLRPFPNRSELLGQLTEIMSPLVPPAELLGDAPVRSVGGLGQIMHAESSRDAYAQLTTAPILKPLDWTRSRVRREHLISMGVPVNLDEVDSHRISALPPLRITTAEGRRTASLDVRNGNGNGNGRSNSRDKGKGREEGPRSAAPALNGSGAGGERGKYGLGVKPELDIEKAEELCGLGEDRLSILPLATLRKIQDEIVKTSAQASASLAWGLQFKDAQSQDSATHNGMISELISNAAKAKSAQQTGSGGVFRRSSQKVPIRSGSGAQTPRVGSPAMR